MPDFTGNKLCCDDGGFVKNVAVTKQKSPPGSALAAISELGGNPPERLSTYADRR
jgi:hypothetical protein